MITQQTSTDIRNIKSRPKIQYPREEVDGKQKISRKIKNARHQRSLALNQTTLKKISKSLLDKNEENHRVFKSRQYQQFQPPTSHSTDLNQLRGHALQVTPSIFSRRDVPQKVIELHNVQLTSGESSFYSQDGIKKRIFSSKTSSDNSKAEGCNEQLKEINKKRLNFMSPPPSTHIRRIASLIPEQSAIAQKSLSIAATGTARSNLQKSSIELENGLQPGQRAIISQKQISLDKKKVPQQLLPNYQDSQNIDNQQFRINTVITDSQYFSNRNPISDQFISKLSSTDKKARDIQVQKLQRADQISCGDETYSQVEQIEVNGIQQEIQDEQQNQRSLSANFILEALQINQQKQKRQKLRRKISNVDTDGLKSHHSISDIFEANQEDEDGFFGEDENDFIQRYKTTDNQVLRFDINSVTLPFGSDQK